MTASGQTKQTGKQLFHTHTQKNSSRNVSGRQKRIKWRKLGHASQKELVLLLSDLLQNGFTLQESLEFASQLFERDKHAVTCFTTFLEKGEPFHQGFSALGFPKEVVAQISLSDIHGDLPGTLEKIGKRMADEAKQRVLFRKVMSYPALLIVFLIVMLLGLKYFLLPQMDFGMQTSLHQKNPGILFIEYAPNVLLGSFLAITIICLVINSFLQRISAINRSKFLVRIPFVRVIFQYHFTSFFSLEWGKLILQGLELRTVIDVMMKDGSTPLMKEIAIALQNELEKGNPIHEQLARWSFFTPSLSLIIQQGEIKGKLGEELMIYGRKLWEILLIKTEKWFQLIQPIVFLFVALLIVAIYAAMLLPMYQNMEGIL